MIEPGLNIYNCEHQDDVETPDFVDRSWELTLRLLGFVAQLNND